MTTKKGGRPTRAQASRKALAKVKDIDQVDPLRTLREVCADASAPAAARVAAAKALMRAGGSKKDSGDGAELDRVSQRALCLLKGGRR